MTPVLTKKQIIILLGAPGCGKGSQANLLKEKLHIPHISTGYILRENIKNGTPLGKKAKSYMDRGELGPDSLIVDILFDRVAKADCKRGYILDGFPRTLSQGKILQERLGSDCEILALYFDVSSETILQRILGRLLCKKCQTPYHSTFSPPKTTGKCDLCSSELFQREDDREEIALKRLSVYSEQTAPLLDFFNNQGLLRSIPCETTKEEVFTNLIKLIPQIK